MSGNEIENHEAAVAMTRYDIRAEWGHVTQLVLTFDVINGFKDRSIVTEFMASIDELCQKKVKK